MGQTEDWRDKKTKVWENRGQEGLRYFGFEEELENMSNQKKKEKSRSIWDRLTALSRYDKKVPPCECVGTATCSETWISGPHAMGTTYRNKIGGIQETLHYWKKSVAYPVGKIEDFVKHVFREHTQEGDHLANVVEVRRREGGVTIDGVKNTEMVKAS